MPATTQQIYQFRSQFGEFTNSSDADIANALNIAMLWVDQSVWSAKDYPQAVLLWAAHYLNLWLLEKASVQVGGTGDSSLYIQSISFGERHIEFQQRQQPSGLSEMLAPGEQLLLNTIYGQMYLMLRQRNVIPFRIV